MKPTITAPVLSTRVQIRALSCDKTFIANDGKDTAIFYATITDAMSDLPLSGISVDWNTTLGSLSADASYTDSSGVALVSLIDAGDTGNAIVMARLSHGSARSLKITLTSTPGCATLYSKASYEGEMSELKEHDSMLLRNNLRQWLWQSTKPGTERLLCRTVIQDENTFNFWGYADSVEIDDVVDLTPGYDLSSSSEVEATALGSDDLVIRGALLSSCPGAVMVACAVQSWPTVMLTVSLFDSGNSNAGILVIMNKNQKITTVPLMVGTLDTEGVATWRYTTSLIATWDDPRQLPRLMLASVPSEGLLLGPVEATDRPGIYKTTLLAIKTPGTITALESNKQSLMVDGKDHAALTATVTDRNQRPLENMTVFWTATSGLLSTASSTTDAKGCASTTLTATQEDTINTTATLENGESESIALAAKVGSSTFPYFTATNVKAGSTPGTIGFELIAHGYPGSQHYIFRFYIQSVCGNNPGIPTTALYLTDTASVYLSDTAHTVTSQYIQQNATTAIHGSDWTATLHIVIDNLNLAEAGWQGGIINLNLSNGGGPFNAGPDIYIPAL